MPKGEKEKRVLRLEAHKAAIELLMEKKREVVIRSALWQRTYQAEHETARLRARIDELDQARRDIIIVAATGIFACVAAYAATTYFLAGTGASYTSFSMATPQITTAATVFSAEGATSITVTHPLRIAFSKQVKAQIVKTIASLPLGAALTYTVKDSALSRVYKLANAMISHKDFSPEEYEKLRAELLKDSIGATRHQLLSANIKAREAQIKQLLKEDVAAAIANHYSEELIGLKPYIAGLLLMTKDEQAIWYRKFRQDIDKYLGKTYPDLSGNEKSILYTNLMWYFWQDVINELRSLEQRWNGHAKLLNDAIMREHFKMSELFGGR